ncbi:MAG TPA: VWA domain-containing protein [Gemmatales bacterium]|nr:VWA domain-containing protein [Gemmatales bacterium]
MAFCIPCLLVAQDDYRLQLLGTVDASRFPEVGIKFRILDKRGEPARELPKADILILEDGREVHRVTPKVLKDIPASTVLIFDTSGSMARQEKMAEAQQASRQFLQQLDTATRCGLVLFHHEVYSQFPLSDQRSALLQALEQARPAGGTAYLDAIKHALHMLGEGHEHERQALVVMTDGRDVNSVATLQEVIELARQRETPIHTIGLGEAGKQLPVRTLLVLDKSGSMLDHGKMSSLKKAATRYVNLLPEQGAETSLITFSSVVSSAGAFTSDKDRLRSKIEAITPGGDTAIYDALWEALETMNAVRVSKGQSTAREALILLTDGLDNRSRHMPQTVIERARQEGVRIFTLGLGTGREVDTRLLDTMARETGGEFYHVQSQERLTDVFEQLSIALHDDGIDEQSLQKLSSATDGLYFHVREMEKLQAVFEKLAATVENTHAVQFTSHRTRHDGTARGIEIRLGTLSSLQTNYAIHGMLTPQSHSGIYLLGLITLFGLLILPVCFSK